MRYYIEHYVDRVWIYCRETPDKLILLYVQSKDGIWVQKNTKVLWTYGRLEEIDIEKFITDNFVNLI